MNEKLYNKHFIIITIFFALFFLIFYRLVNLQVINGKSYYEKAQNRLLNSQVVPAPRGEITDRYGRAFVTNETGFSVEITKNSDTDNDTLNRTVLNVINVLNDHNEKYTDNLPVTYFPYEYTSDDEKFALDESGKNKLTAPEKMAVLFEKYGIDEKYSENEKRLLAGVRYEMESRNFSTVTPFTLAAGVSLDTVTILKEQKLSFPNVSIVTRPVRKYPHDGLASHVLGRVGIIYKEEFEALKGENYSMNAIIGKDGMEKYLERYIRGKDGKKVARQTISNTLSGSENISPIPGNNAALTIDMDLQRVAQDSLAEVVSGIPSASGGSVVAIDVQNGGILAIASYPTYSLENFDRDYESMSKNPKKPMFNRAIGGVYEPGSTFKMITSVAALEGGYITPQTKINDNGVFELSNQKFNCWIWTSQHQTHGSINVSEALRDSCNYFYYTLGNKMGIDEMLKWGRNFGIAELTGIEIPGEARGNLASPEYKQEVFKTPWYPGDTVQCAIGQSFNLFTPIELASYTATIANGGTRYRAHLLKNVKDYKTGKVVFEPETEKLGQVEMSKSTYDAVTKGMRLVASEGTAKSYFEDFGIEVCCKTGSAQVGKKDANGVFVCYAPYKNPEIAVAVVVEAAGSGSSTIPIAKNILKEYFNIE